MHWIETKGTEDLAEIAGIKVAPYRSLCRRCFETNDVVSKRC